MVVLFLNNATFLIDKVAVRMHKMPACIALLEPLAIVGKTRPLNLIALFTYLYRDFCSQIPLSTLRTKS